MIEVVVNGKESRKYAGKVKLEEIVGDLYPEGKILESITINGKEIPLSNLEGTVVKDGENVSIQFISLDEGITNIAKSALEFIEWVNSQNMDDDHVFGNLSKLSSGFEIMENAIFSIESTGRKIESEEESKEILKAFEEINSFTALENKEEVREKIKKVTEIYKRIFSRILEGGTVNE
jgi:hypothetical protein